MSETGNCPGGWCGKKDKKRSFVRRAPIICYDKAPATNISRNEYDQQRYNCLLGSKTQDFIIEKRSSKSWTMEQGQLCRITVVEGSQVGDLNFWNLTNPKERFYSGKTRQLHASHLTTYDRLWSSLPFLRPMATVVGDSLAGYGIDEDGGSCHDVVGTRCDNYTYSLITGQQKTTSCHQLLTEAIKGRGLSEDDVHDVWNIFMCTGFYRKTGQYFCKASPAEKGDYIEFISDMPLLVALSVCPQGDVSTPVGKPVPDQNCHPLQVEVFSSNCSSAITSK